MSEFWISRPKWTCKYCNITINDDVPSKTQHLNGMRHKNAVERALKDVYKKSERERNDKERMAREMKRIEREAIKAHRGDLERTAATPTATAGPSLSAQPVPASSTSTPAPAPPAAWKPKDKFSAYSTAASLGFGAEMEQDQKSRQEREQRERLAAEEKERRDREGQPGEWEVVMPVARPRAVEEAGGSSGWAARSNTLSTSTSNYASASTSVTAPSESGEPATQGTQRRGAFLSERVLDTASDDEEDDGLSRIRLKKRIKVDPSSASPSGAGGGVDRRGLPQGQPVRLEIKPAAGVKAAGAAKKEEPERMSSTSSAGVKKEESANAVDEGGRVVAARFEPDEGRLKASASGDISSPSASAPASSSGSGGGGGLFKKRKAGAGAGAKRIGQLR